MLDIKKNKQFTVKSYDLKTGKMTSVVNTISKSMSNYINDDNNNIKKHPFDFNGLADLLQLDATHSASINIKKSMIMGNGWELTQGKNANKMKRIEKFIEQPNQNPFNTFYQLIEQFTVDSEVFANAYIGFAKINNKTRFTHIPSRDIFIKTKANNVISEYVQLDVNGKIVKTYKSYDGTSAIKSGVQYLAHFKNYSPMNSYYGIPSYVSAISAIVENTYIRDFGINFFNNAATPSLALFITGGQWGDEHDKAVRDFLRKDLKGVDNAHKLLMLHVDDSNAKIELQEVSKILDGNFLKESDKNRDEIARAHDSIPPKLLGISGASSIGGGGESIGELKTFLETCINGKQTKIEDFINTLFLITFGINPKFKLNRIDITTAKDDAVIYSLLSKIVDAEGNSVYTINEIREYLNKSPHKTKAKMPIANNKAGGNTSGDAVTGENTESNGTQDEITNIDEGNKIKD